MQLVCCARHWQENSPCIHDPVCYFVGSSFVDRCRWYRPYLHGGLLPTLLWWWISKHSSQRSVRTKRKRSANIRGSRLRCYCHQGDIIIIFGWIASRQPNGTVVFWIHARSSVGWFIDQINGSWHGYNDIPNPGRKLGMYQHGFWRDSNETIHKYLCRLTLLILHRQ